jgi:hypothetical protein
MKKLGSENDSNDSQTLFGSTWYFLNSMNNPNVVLKPTVQSPPPHLVVTLPTNSTQPSAAAHAVPDTHVTAVQPAAVNPTPPAVHPYLYQKKKSVHSNSGGSNDHGGGGNRM